MARRRSSCSYSRRDSGSSNNNSFCSGTTVEVVLVAVVAGRQEVKEEESESNMENKIEKEEMAKRERGRPTHDNWVNTKESSYRIEFCVENERKVKRATIKRRNE